LVINLFLYSFFFFGDESKFFLFNFSLTNLYGHNFLLSILIFFFIFIFISSISEKNFTNIKYIPFESNFILGFLFIGIIFLIYSFDFLTMFLNLELQNFALYILMNIQRNKKIVVETSIKYYIIGGVSSGFILYGISLIYLTTGKINFFDLILYFYNIQDFNSILFLGILFIFCGLFIKLGLAPFHFWVPQIYSGAPNFIMLILLSLPKFVLILVFIKLYFFVFSFTHNIFFPLISFSIILSLILVL
jgi:NADH-quinone oxidoreductase subunit N